MSYVKGLCENIKGICSIWHQHVLQRQQNNQEHTCPQGTMTSYSAKVVLYTSIDVTELTAMRSTSEDPLEHLSKDKENPRVPSPIYPLEHLSKDKEDPRVPSPICNHHTPTYQLTAMDDFKTVGREGMALSGESKYQYQGQQSHPKQNHK